MKYIEFINNLIKKESIKKTNLLLFGQNINSGSCLGGLTRNIKLRDGSRIIDTQNSENSLVGFGFGLMINRISSVYFMKQMDFLLLGIDQMVNTYGFIRNLYDDKNKASFSIVATVYDGGYDGVQSSLNVFGDFCSIGRLPGLTITNAIDAKKIISSDLVSPGFRIIGLSARLSKDEIIAPDKLIYASPDNTFFQYTDGSDATIVCFNFSFPQGWRLHTELENKGMHTTLINVNSPIAIDWSYIIKQATKTRKLIIMDDSKSANLACDNLALVANMANSEIKIIIIKRQLRENWLNPMSDKMEVNLVKVIKELK
ncbi:MAG: hypothetical protein V1719_00705 [Patescibacteria group bacterium]